MRLKVCLCVGVLVGAFLAAAPPAAAGLVAYYTFDAAGNLGQDTSSSGYHATNFGATYNAAGRFGGAAEFAGTNEYLQLPSNAVLDGLQNLPGYTIAAWVRADQVPPGTGDQNNARYGIIQKAGWHSGLAYTNARTFAMDAWRAGNVWAGAATTTTYPPLEWRHVLATVDKPAGSVRVYVDGIHVGTGSFTPGTDARDYGTMPWRIGIANPGAGTYRWPMDGLIDDAALWRTVLPESFIQRLGAGTASPLNTPVPVAEIGLANHANVGGAAYARDPLAGDIYGPVYWRLERLNHTYVTGGVMSAWYLGYQATTQQAFLDLATTRTPNWSGELPFIAWGDHLLPNKYPPQTPYSGDMSTFSTRYWGEFYVPPDSANPSAPRTVRFREYNDDYTLFSVDGSVVFYDSAWTNFYGVGGDTGKIIPLTLTPGWHSFEYFHSEAGGGDNARLLWDYDPLSNTFGGANPFITVGSAYYRYSVPQLLAEGWSNIGGPGTLTTLLNLGSSPGEVFDLRLAVTFWGSTAYAFGTFIGIPEPATLLLLGGGLAALARRRRKRPAGPAA